MTLYATVSHYPFQPASFKRVNDELLQVFSRDRLNKCEIRGHKEHLDQTEVSLNRLIRKPHLANRKGGIVTNSANGGELVWSHVAHPHVTKPILNSCPDEEPLTMPVFDCEKQVLVTPEPSLQQMPNGWETQFVGNADPGEEPLVMPVANFAR